MKICNRCKRNLEESAFAKDSTKKDGLQSYCRECRSQMKKQWISENKEYVQEYQRKWFADNPGYQREYYQKTIDRQHEYQKKYKSLHRDEANERCAKWYQEHIEEQRKKKREYKQQNKKYFADYERDKKRGDEFYRFKCYIRHFMWESFRRKDWKKCKKTQDIIGCTMEEARSHLERTWMENYGTPYNGEPVHIDHIVPLSTAKTEDDVIRLCHISNLQYLKPEDNCSKRDSIDWEI